MYSSKGKKENFLKNHWLSIVTAFSSLFFSNFRFWRKLYLTNMLHIVYIHILLAITTKRAPKKEISIDDRIVENISLQFCILIQILFFFSVFITLCCFVLDPNSERRYLTNNTCDNWFSEWNSHKNPKQKFYI